MKGYRNDDKAQMGGGSGVIRRFPLPKDLSTFSHLVVKIFWPVKTLLETIISSSNGFKHTGNKSLKATRHEVSLEMSLPHVPLHRYCGCPQLTGCSWL